MNISNLAIPVDRLRPQGSLEDGITIAQEMGITATTFFGIPKPYRSGESIISFLWDELDRPTRQAIHRVRNAFKRAVIHAPFRDVPLVSSNPYIEQETRRQLLMSVRAAGALELEAVTIHAGLPLGMARDEFNERLIDALWMLGEEATSVGTKIGLENWRYPATPEDHLYLLETVNHPAVGATLDIGHIAYWFQNEGVYGLQDDADVQEYHRRLYNFIEHLGSHIIHIHVHDVRAADLKDHRPAGTGIIDYPTVIQRLDAVGFDGVMLFEVASSEDAEGALQSSVQTLLQAMA